MKGIRILLHGVGMVGWLGACGPSTPTLNPEDDYQPLDVGRYWIYSEAGSTSGTVTKQVTGTETFDGRETFIWETTQTNSLNAKRSNWWDNGSRVERLRQQAFVDGTLITTRTYNPGFLRFDRTLQTPGASLDESHIRSETDHRISANRDESKDYTWRLETVSDTVTVPAGTFDCIRVRRLENDGDREAKVYWYAPGVGKVAEESLAGETVIERQELLEHGEGGLP